MRYHIIVVNIFHDCLTKPISCLLVTSHTFSHITARLLKLLVIILYNNDLNVVILVEWQKFLKFLQTNLLCILVDNYIKVEEGRFLFKRLLYILNDSELNMISCVEFLWISTIFDPLDHFFWSSIIVIMKNYHRHVRRNSIVVCFLKMSYNIFLNSFPSAWNKFKSRMLIIFNNVLKIFRNITINQKFLPQLFILVDCQLLQIVKLVHQLLLSLFSLWIIVCPYYKGQHLFRFVQKTNLFRIVIIFDLDVSEEIFQQSCLNFMRFIVFKTCRNPDCYYATEFEIEIFW